MQNGDVSNVLRYTTEDFMFNRAQSAVGHCRAQCSFGSELLVNTRVEWVIDRRIWWRIRSPLPSLMSV
jgi:hypothetical protein